MSLKFFVLLAIVAVAFTKNCSDGQAEVLLPNNGAECVVLPAPKLMERQPVITLGDIIDGTRVQRSAPPEESFQPPEKTLLTREELLSLTKINGEEERVQRRSGFEECTYMIENSVTLSACMPVVIKTLRTDFGTVTIIEIGEEALKRAKSTTPASTTSSETGEDDQVIKRETSSSLNLALEMESIQAEMEAAMISHKSVKRTMSQDDVPEEPETCLMTVENNTVACTNFTVVKRSTSKGATVTMVEIPSSELSADTRERLSGTIDENGDVVIVEMVSNAPVIGTSSNVPRSKRDAEELPATASVAPMPAVFPDNVITARLLSPGTPKPPTLKTPVEEGN